MEDMCQLSERLTEYKYQGSHELVAKLISKYSSVPKLDLVKYWEQVLFSWLIGNADMHLKNYSLYAPMDNEYQLTPAYDLLSTALVIPEDTEELALTLCGKKRKFTRQHFIEAMIASGLDEKVCDNIFARFGRLLPEWEACIRQSFLPKEMQEQGWQSQGSGEERLRLGQRSQLVLSGLRAKSKNHRQKTEVAG